MNRAGPASVPIAAVATPPGRGGIGIVRVSGSDLGAIVHGIVGGPLEPRRASLARFHDGKGQVLDEGVALFFAGPASYTGEDTLELHAHGSPAVLALVLARCVELGARIAEPGEFTRRAFLNGRLDLAQAEGVADLIEASTATAARAAARSLTGEFSRAVQAVVSGLIDLRVRVEASLDFPEEDVARATQEEASQGLEHLRVALGDIAARARRGRLLREGLNAVLVGAPNVGKSSVLNRLVGEDVAIVTAIPGTTRDTIRERLELDGIPLHIVDTAGLRETDDIVERAGIERTWAAIDTADLALIVVDASAPADRRHSWFDRLPPGLPRIVVHNKIDLARVPARAEIGAEGADVWLSALTGAGFDGLSQSIRAAAGVHESLEDAFLARERHIEALSRAGQRLVAAALHLEIPPALELCAEELRLAQGDLSAITGEFSADDLLGAIFSRFCIGK